MHVPFRRLPNRVGQTARPAAPLPAKSYDAAPPPPPKGSALLTGSAQLPQPGVSAGLGKTPLAMLLQSMGPVNPAETIACTAQQVLHLPCVAEGLNCPYSPNHLQTSLEVARNEMKEVAELQRMVAGRLNSAEFPAHFHMLREVAKDFKLSDWKLLTLLCGFHDIGHINRAWLQVRGYCSDALGFNHDFDAPALLQQNPQLLAQMRLSEDEQAELLKLIEWHTLPGQILLGEGGPEAYANLLREGADPNKLIRIALVHGLLDIRAALGKKFDTNAGLRDSILSGYKDLIPQVESLFNYDAGQIKTTQQSQAGLRPEQVTRLLKLMKWPPENQQLLADAFLALPAEVQKAYREAEWYGTYVSMAAGEGLCRRGIDPAVALQTLCKLIAQAALAFQKQGGVGEFAVNFSTLSTLTPQEVIAQANSPNSQLDWTVKNRGVALVAQAIKPTPLEISSKSWDDVPETVRNKLPRWPFSTTPTVQNLANVTNLLATGSASSLAPVLGQILADKVVRARQGNRLSAVKDLAANGIIDGDQCAVLQCYEKLAQIVCADFPAAQVVNEQFFRDLQLHITSLTDKTSILKAMQDVVRMRPHIYTLQGEKIAAFQLNATRVIDPFGIYQFHLSEAAKLALATREIHNANDFIQAVIRQPAVLAETVAEHPLIGTVSGYLGVGWWEPKGNGSVELESIIADRGLQPERFRHGLALVILPADDAYAQKCHVPTPFDGLAFDEWVPRPLGFMTGRTVGAGFEVVAPPIQVASCQTQILVGANPT